MTKAGWYQDPENPGGQRYYDGKQWTEQRTGQPPPPPGRQKGGGCFGTMAKIALGVILGVALLIGGCALLLGGAADEIEKDAQEHAITKDEYDSVEQGASQEDVEAELGTPDDSQESETKGLGSDSCIYYNEEGKELFEGDSYQFCFEEGKLRSKSIY